MTLREFQGILNSKLSLTAAGRRAEAVVVAISVNFPLLNLCPGGLISSSEKPPLARRIKQLAMSSSSSVLDEIPLEVVICIYIYLCMYISYQFTLSLITTSLSHASTHCKLSLLSTMNFEIMEEFGDQIIVKGKRTKRLRPSSSTSSSGADFNYNSSVSSPTTSSGISSSTEEDEDMANCLILLARGGFSEEEIKPPGNKFSSRKFTEIATTTSGKVGIYVYECKTCSRTFPSFQALGGHRASHKKPKSTGEVKLTAAAAAPRDEEEEGVKFNKQIVNSIAPSTSTVVQSENKPKLHECSICGSEFSSGQALGGHMRRHRSVMNGASTRSGEDHDDQKSRNMLALDLNLPAPAEDDLRETEFHQFSSNQQPRLVFSAAALVDCHY